MFLNQFRYKMDTDSRSSSFAVQMQLKPSPSSPCSTCRFLRVGRWNGLSSKGFARMSILWNLVVDARARRLPASRLDRSARCSRARVTARPVNALARPFRNQGGATTIPA